MNYNKRSRFYVPSAKAATKPVPAVDSKNEVEILREEVASLRRGLKGRAHRFDDVSDDDDAPAHRRRSKKPAKQRSFCYKVLCCGCEPSCLLESTSTVTSYGCYVIVVIIKIVAWIGIGFFLIWNSFR